MKTLHFLIKVNQECLSNTFKITIDKNDKNIYYIHINTEYLNLDEYTYHML